MDYAKDLIKEDNYDENVMTDDEMSDLIGGYGSDDLSTEVKCEVTVIVCDKIKNTEEEKYTYFRIVKSLSESDKYFEWVVTVTNPKDESNH